MNIEWVCVHKIVKDLSQGLNSFTPLQVARLVIRYFTNEFIIQEFQKTKEKLR